MTARPLICAVGTAWLAAACAETDAKTTATADATSAAAASERSDGARPADSLVLTAPGGVEVWYTLGRPDSGGGRQCVDRAIEIRRDGARMPVPLLYTGTAPELVDDTTLRARLSSRCRPGAAYRVDLRTGRPTRERP